MILLDTHLLLWQQQGDPADRLIVATALEGHQLVTADHRLLQWPSHLSRLRATKRTGRQDQPKLLADLLGAAYEYLIKYFADSAGKKGGEFYTPAEVVRLLVQLTKPEAGNEIYDPTVGSGGFVIQAHQNVEEQGQDTNDLFLYGQDSNGTTWSICNMNMILHNVTRFTIENCTAPISWTDKVHHTLRVGCPTRSIVELT